MDKLQALTEKLYSEGLEKGRQEGQALLEKAKAEADSILKAAKEEAAAIVEAARKEAEDHRVKTEGDVKMAATQALQTARTSIENLIISKAVDAPATKALEETAFLKEIILEVAKHFSATETADLSIILPEKIRAEVEPYIGKELAKTVGKGTQEVGFSKKINAGFKIGPADGSYIISLTDEAFKALIGEYLRPATKKVLFG